jgi:hypothetical protein
MENSEVFQECVQNYQFRAAQNSFPHQISTGIPFSARINCWGAYARENSPGVVAFFTFVLAASTIALWLSTKKLWRITDETLEHAQETSRKELRAYIGVEPAGITRYLARPEDGPERILGHFVIHNVGNVPAQKVSIFSAIEWSEDGERRTFEHRPVEDSPTALQPRGQMQFGTGNPLATSNIKPDPSKPSTRWLGYLYVWGRVTYTDEFETDGWTNFCHRYNCATKPDTSSVDFDPKFARYHETAGNEAG